jgi:hypothetical protein
MAPTQKRLNAPIRNKNTAAFAEEFLVTAFSFDFQSPERSHPMIMAKAERLKRAREIGMLTAMPTTPQRPTDNAKDCNVEKFTNQYESSSVLAIGL